MISAEAQSRFWTPFKPPPRLTISEWADRYIFLPKRGNAEPGKFRLSRVPYQAALLDDPLDPNVTETFWMIGAQLVKTLSLLIINGYYIAQDPSSILVVYPTIGDAESFSKTKFEPFRKENDVLRNVIDDSSRRTGEVTILNKSFPGGDLTMAGANSPSTLRQRSKRIILLDEIDGYKPNSEGDPIEQADARAKTFHNAVKIKCSTPTRKGLSAIEAGYERSDKQMWFCPCPKCRHKQTLKWSQVKWTFDLPDGTQASKPEEAVYVCEKCEAHLNDSERIGMIMAGEWKATAPFNGVRGRHLNGLYRLIGKQKGYRSYLHEFVEGFLKVCKNREKLMVWTNVFLTETFEDRVERKDFSQLMKRLEDYGPRIPAAARVLVCTIDVQFNRVEILVVAFAQTDEAWTITAKTIYGNPHQPQLWAEVDRFVNQPFEHQSGAKIWIGATFIDSGGQSGREGFSKPVYAFVHRRQKLGRGGCWACKGVETNNGQIRRENKVHKGVVLLQLVGTDETKSLIYSRLDIEEPGPGYIHYRNNGEFNAEWFQQLTGEEVQTVKIRGFAKRKWVKVRDRNEALDQFAYAVAALDKLNPDWKSLDRIYGPKTETKTAETPAKEPSSITVKPAQPLEPRHAHGLRRRPPRLWRDR